MIAAVSAVAGRAAAAVRRQSACQPPMFTSLLHNPAWAMSVVRIKEQRAMQSCYRKAEAPCPFAPPPSVPTHFAAAVAGWPLLHFARVQMHLLHMLMPSASQGVLAVPTATSRSCAWSAYEASTTGMCATMTDVSWNLPPAPGGWAPPGDSALRSTVLMRIRQAGCWITCS